MEYNTNELLEKLRELNAKLLKIINLNKENLKITDEYLQKHAPVRKVNRALSPENLISYLHKHRN
jgi:hypothetical protein